MNREPREEKQQIFINIQRIPYSMPSRIPELLWISTLSYDSHSSSFQTGVWSHYLLGACLGSGWGNKDNLSFYATHAKPQGAICNRSLKDLRFWNDCKDLMGFFFPVPSTMCWYLSSSYAFSSLSLCHRHTLEVILLSLLVRCDLV